MKSILSIITDKGFWSGTLQIAFGIYIAMSALILTIVLVGEFLPFLGVD